MKKPFLYRRLSKYKTKKFIFDCGIIHKKQAQEILKQRQYVEHSEYWIKGFVKVYMLDASFMVCVDHTSNKDNGCRGFYEKQIFIQTLQYFENKLK